MSLRFEDRELQITLTELQIKTQRKTSEYTTYTSFLLSSMIVIAFTLYTWALTEKNMSYVYAAYAIILILFLSFIGLNRYYSDQLDKLEQQIGEVRKKYVW